MILRLVPILAAALLVLLSVPPAVAEQREPEILGIVGGQRITNFDAEQRLNRTGGPRPAETPEEALTRAGNEILAELVVEQMLARTPDVNPRLAGAIAQARREILLDFYIRSNMEEFQPADADIQAFIDENPQFFGDRASFWVTQFRIGLPEGADRSALDAALDGFGPDRATPERLLEFQSILGESGLPFQRLTIWRSSEQLSPEGLQQLEDLHASGEPFLTVEGEGWKEVAFLKQRSADPIDPQLQRGQVAQILAQQQYAAQREALVNQLAGRARRGQDVAALPPESLAPGDEAAPPAAAAPPPPQVVVQRAEAWMYGVIGGMGLMLPLVMWSGAIVPGAMSRRSPWRWPARLGIAAVILGGLGASAWITSRLLPILGAQTFIALAVGGFVLGVLSASVWARAISLSQPEPTRATLRFLAMLGLLVVVFAVYALYRLHLL